ncbi:unnamed protein product [Tilletia controversa]|uniref:VHS domain-containing protein n=3 Tax=Tilletia TaxID=13289 RepID=A0A8X7MJ44_9BASI|nr:hypothetical protein CF336_g8171 [Tilletia laevis]KAE8184378.1 hypothetical protein CF328_g7876 [Tilletia controversa]KAE8243567.1 hypothetical protein A4X03_0g7722 [Tilletia caries]KAE8201557.1 hypothetical protein CF335_g3711 [Tilletia laevis]KAE8237692.1 hypothetical protein A4X06_0g9146 [Tilletia controversa]
MIKNRVQEVLGTQKPHSSVSDHVDRLCSEEYEEEEYGELPELVTAIKLQPATGTAEASRSIRKKLKYGSVHAQKRAIFILGALVANGGTRFQQSFADERLVHTIKLTSSDPLIDLSVRKKLMRLLYSWAMQFKSDPQMFTVARLYNACGGGQKSAAQLRSEAAELVRKREEAAEKEQRERGDRKAAERRAKQEEKDKALAKKLQDQERAKNRGSRAAVSTFNFEKEKPVIQTTLAQSSQFSTALVNALQLVNRDKESVETNARVQEYLGKVKAERKRVVRYIQLVQQHEETLGALIAANDQVLLALQLYDKLSKPPELDSDDEIAASAAVDGKYVASDAEIELVRQRIADAGAHGGASNTNLFGDDFGGREQQPRSGSDQLVTPLSAQYSGASRDADRMGELEKLQYVQRARLDRHSSSRGDSGYDDVVGGVSRDLMDLNFDDDQGGYEQQPSSSSSSALPPSLRPVRTDSANAAAAAAAHSRNPTHLFSDESDSEYEYDDPRTARNKGNDRNDQVAPQWTGTSDSTNVTEEEWARISSRQPQIGPGHEYVPSPADGDEYDDYGGVGEEEDGEEEYDPFADEPPARPAAPPFGKQGPGYGGPSRPNAQRQSFAAV